MRPRFWIFIFLFVFAGWTHAFEWDASKFMSVDEIKPGMKAKAHTVFSGTKVETFDLEIMSIRSTGQGRRIVWALGKGNRIEHTGVAQGMSGSPVYIKNRLIGAIAYTYPNAKDAWAGITPIEEMLPILNREMSPRVSRAGSSFGIGQYLETLGALQDGQIRLTKSDAIQQPSEVFPERLKIPLMFAGFQQGAIEILRPFFSDQNIVPMQGGNTSQQDVTYPLDPGKLIAMVYATGDQALYGYGTVTYREGNKILAFGHPASNEGRTYYPIAGGWVDHVIASRVISSKQGSIGKIGGTLVQDRTSGIAGVVGQVPPMAPLRVRVNPDSGTVREYNYNVFLGDERLAGAIAGALVWNSIESAERGSGDYTADIQVNIAIEGKDPIVKRIAASGSASPAAAAYLSLSPLLSAITNNEFTPLTVQNMNVDVTLRDKRHIASIEEVRLNKNIFRPGEEILATVVLRPYLEDPVLEPIRIQIPDDVADGPVNLMITNAASHQNWQRTRAPENYRPRDVEQLLDILREGESSYDIVSELFVPKLGMTVEGEEYPELPFSMLYVMSSPTQSGESSFTRGTTLSVQYHTTPYVIAGSRTFRITVDRNAR